MSRSNLSTSQSTSGPLLPHNTFKVNQSQSFWSAPKTLLASLDQLWLLGAALQGIGGEELHGVLHLLGLYSVSVPTAPASEYCMTLPVAFWVMVSAPLIPLVAFKTAAINRDSPLAVPQPNRLGRVATTEGGLVHQHHLPSSIRHASKVCCVNLPMEGKCLDTN